MVQKLLNNKLIVDNELGNLQLQLGYIFTKDDGNIEAIMKTVCKNKTVYFVFQKGKLVLININEIQYNQTIDYMREYHRA